MPSGIQDTVTGKFETPEKFLSELDPQVAGTLVAAAADVVLVVDDQGIICDLAFGNPELSAYGHKEWLGRPWAQTVTADSQPKVEAMLSEANANSGVKWRHVNHLTSTGEVLPLSYSVVTVRRPGKTKGSVTCHTMAFGRDLRAQVALQQRLVSAQLSMERDYWRLRHVETRYRLLFQLATEAVLVLDATTEKLEEANPAAFALLGDKPNRPTWTLDESLDDSSKAVIRQLLIQLRANGHCEPATVRLDNSTEDLTVSVALFRQENSAHFMVRLIPAHGVLQSDSSGINQLKLNAIENAPDALVVTDLFGSVLSANRAFLDLVQIANERLAMGESLEKWLGRTGVDLSVLLSNLRQRGVVRLYATSLRGEYGSTANVEISAVSLTGGEKPCLGFTLRDVGRRIVSDGRTNKELPRSAGQMTELVGRVPLRDIVRETTDLIEQLCIEAALDLTGDNRASAAEMLGLSRQSLYVKLRRFSIGDAVAEE